MTISCKRFLWVKWVSGVQKRGGPPRQDRQVVVGAWVQGGAKGVSARCNPPPMGGLSPGRLAPWGLRRSYALRGMGRGYYLPWAFVAPAALYGASGAFCFALESKQILFGIDKRSKEWYNRIIERGAQYGRYWKAYQGTAGSTSFIPGRICQIVREQSSHDCQNRNRENGPFP